MTDKQTTRKRITRGDLLMGGWHCICNIEGVWWAHHRAPRLARFSDAARLYREGIRDE